MIDQIKFYPAIMKSAPPFCSFIKKLYLCSKMSCTSMQITQVCRNQNSCQLITSFLNFPHKLFILSGLWDYSKNTIYLFHVPVVVWFRDTKVSAFCRDGRNKKRIIVWHLPDNRLTMPFLTLLGGEWLFFCIHISGKWDGLLVHGLPWFL